MTTSFDWAGLRRHALSNMGLKPCEFWALTPAEFLDIAGLTGGADRMTRAGLEALVRQFPDTGDHSDSTG